ncbi:MAG: hypothetical protein EXS50_02685 [Candidatus Taylorbacteria bacterium]|nr:hypothetical protein [Candidatus Taylorbacteria bacterium]
MKKLFATFLFSLVLVFFTANFALANDWTFTDSFESYNLGNLDRQGGWTVTNYNGKSGNTADISTIDLDEGEKYVEIINVGSTIVTHDITPIHAGIFQFRVRHNKSGLFYFYALTSDAGGQLLFSIQFTELNGIFLEEGSEQITLLPDYNANQWYLFTIDFDNTRGKRGTFKIKINNGSYSEHEYVNSESDIFDFANITFGSESNGTAISAFGDIKSTQDIMELVVSEVIKENTSTTSIVSDLSGGQTTTAIIDGATTLETVETSSSFVDSPSNMTASVIEAVIFSPENIPVPSSEIPVSETPNNISGENNDTITTTF